MTSERGQRGFSLLEILAVIAIMGVLSIFAMPVTSRSLGDLRLRGDARSLSNAIGLTKMRAASSFTRTRLFVDHSTDAYLFQFWDRATSDWVTEGGSVETSTGVTFSFGSLATPPPNTQVAIGQSPVCKDKDGDDIGNTSCILFNSRGIPIDDDGAPTGGNALYLTDGTGVYATTVTATPLIRLWWTPASRAAWVQQ